MFGSNKENKQTEDENFEEDIVVLKAQISKLTVENESYKQQLHALNRKFENEVTMQSELIESNEALEQSLRDHKATFARRINEVEERHTALRKELEERIEEMEAELVAKSKENGELCEKIKISNDMISELSGTQNVAGNEDNLEPLMCQIEELAELLAQEKEIRERLEATVERKESQCNEMKEILTASKRQLAEKETVLEGMRDQLMIYRNELELSKANPESGCKGNSLFAEVEDRRRMTLEQMNAMRNGYIEVKRSFQAKEAEIRSLKAERAIFLRKWEDDTIEKVQQNATLIEKYKVRIAELEKQVKDERKKHAETARSQQLPESRFTFLQSLVDTKKREVEELRTKIENDSINALLEEEAKHKMGKQLRYWRFRAMTGEAQLLSIKHRLQYDPSSSNVDILESMKTLSSSIKDIEFNESMNIDPSHRETTVVDETITTLENLMTIPKPFVHSNEETSDSSLTTSICEKTTIKTESLSVIEKNNATEKCSEDGKLLCKVETAMQTTNVQESKDSSADEAKSEQASLVVNPAAPILKSFRAKANADLSAYLSGKEINERDKKTLRFAADTLDPPGKALKKQTSDKPKYPIVFISSNKS